LIGVDAEISVTDETLERATRVKQPGSFAVRESEASAFRRK